MRYHLFFESQGDAVRASDEVRHLFAVYLGDKLSRGKRPWPVTCELDGFVAGLDQVKANTELFEQLSQRHNGEFDGWEASV